jgi:phosphopantothenoylcysteine synthetase/decarboxylase
MISKIIVTSGPTREWIDPVRYISNSSSGKMGFHLAESAFALCGNIVYIAGGVESKYSTVVNALNKTVVTTEDLLNSVINEMDSNTLLIMAAAPADYRPVSPSSQKIKKIQGQSIISLELTENPDILKQVHQRKLDLGLNDFWTLGFSAETESLEENAKKKLNSKGLDWIAGNYVGKSIGFGDVDSEIILFSKDGSSKKFGPCTKKMLADRIISSIQKDLLLG